jgi:hypothetical protein
MDIMYVGNLGVDFGPLYYTCLHFLAIIYIFLYFVATNLVQSL